MRIALIADIHGNLPALEAVLAAIADFSPDLILSLGDQVNLGPSPREVLALLSAKNVHCLHGNHEGYLLSVFQGDPLYDGANFRSLHFNASVLRPEQVAFDKTYTLDSVLFCHSMPQDDRFPVNDPDLALPLLRQMPVSSPTHIICGHGHNPIHYTLANLTVNGIGSVGCMDDGIPGYAPYSILDLDNGACALRTRFAQYNPAPLYTLFLQSGMLSFCPIMAHIACIQMQHNHDYLLPFVRHARRLMKEAGKTVIDDAVWQQADRTFPWPDACSTSAFWRR